MGNCHATDCDNEYCTCRKCCSKRQAASSDLAKSQSDLSKSGMGCPSPLGGWVTPPSASSPRISRASQRTSSPTTGTSFPALDSYGTMKAICETPTSPVDGRDGGSPHLNTRPSRLSIPQKRLTQQQINRGLFGQKQQTRVPP